MSSEPPDREKPEGQEGMAGTILEVEGLKKHFSQSRGLLSTLRGTRGVIPAVDGVNFFIKGNETMGLVGESGCGKTTIGKMVLRLYTPTDGRILFEGQDITSMSQGAFRPYRKKMQMIFQDLDAALNPKMRIGSILREAVTVHQRLTDAEADARIAGLLEQVNLKKGKLANYPHELSGGEKRRVGIARALSVGARFLVADEPTSALDVSIQAQIVNLLKKLQDTLGLSYLFISHDLRVVELMSHKVAVMYLGKIVEMGLAGRIAHNPLHPYTRVLWSSLVEKQSMEATLAAGEKNDWGVYDFERPASGCRFAPRCPVYADRGAPGICTDPSSEPQLRDVRDVHKVACHFPL
jgi:oligopeptide/dipeptide ABC transporter ATP-binding protein